MTTEQARKLRNLKNFGTRYEVEVRVPSGERFLFCYMDGRSQSKICREARRRYDGLVARFAATEFCIVNPKDAALEDLSKHMIFYTGRTQRDAILEGELPYYNEKPEPKTGEQR